MSSGKVDMSPSWRLAVVPRALALAVAAALLALPGPAWASHMQQYANNPVEHDAQGSVPEPDGRTTSVLGPLLTNTVLDVPPFEGRGQPDPVPKPSGASGGVLAPGCTGAGGARRLDGQCGLWTVGVGSEAPGTIPPPASELGMPGNAAPGAYTPDKGTGVRFLDGRLTWTLAALPVLGVHTVDLNRRLQEGERLAGGPLPGAHATLPHEVYAWAWYGQWTDLNGNGVVDHHTPGTAGPTQNEFAWLGGCLNRNGDRVPGAIQAGLCLEDPNPGLVPPGAPCSDPGSVVGCAGTTLRAWLYPGNHHAVEPASDHPGQQVVMFAQGLGNCAGPPSCDDVAREARGDPLLDRQGEVAPDLTFADRTGDTQGDTERRWGVPAYAGRFYGDDGLLVTFTQVYGVNCGPSAASPHGFALASCTFLDVDRQHALSPTVEELLVGPPGEAPDGGLKRAARSAWLIVRDDTGTATVQRLVDGALHSEDVYLASQGPLRGQANDLALQPGWSREPNAPGDALPGTSWRACAELPVGDPRNPTAEPDPEEREAQHRGWCSTGPSGAYAPHRVQPRGWLDVRLVRNAAFTVPVALVPGQSCQFCVYGITADVDANPEPPAVPRAPGDHRRTLGPGGYWFGGWVGAWHDQPGVRDESVFPDRPGTSLVTYPVDGWVGVVQAASGQWRYRGFAPRACATEQDAPMEASLHEAAVCNPYLDGNVEDPQDYTPAAQGGEFHDRCDDSMFFATMAPADGALDTQVLVWRQHAQGIAPDPLDLDGDGQATLTPRLEAWGPGPVQPLVVGLSCGTNWTLTGNFMGNDYLLWPEGNARDGMVTRVTKSITLGVDLDGDGRPDADRVTDEDAYAAWEPW